MTYELAKKLKEAGFPQDTLQFWARTKGATNFHLSWKGCCSPEEAHEEKVAIPTLSELIEACGEDFEALAVCRGGKWREGKIIGFSCDIEDIYDGKIDGSTPEEAVAALWLALQEKK